MSQQQGEEDVIAERRLAVVGASTKAVRVRIHRPRPDPDGDWICPVDVDGLGAVTQQHGRGIDALQALLNAAEAARYVLDASGLCLQWEGGEPGDVGLPRQVPTAFGLEFSRQIEAHIDRAMEGAVATASAAPAASGT